MPELIGSFVSNEFILKTIILNELLVPGKSHKIPNNPTATVAQSKT